MKPTRGTGHYGTSGENEIYVDGIRFTLNILMKSCYVKTAEGIANENDEEG